MELKPCPFCGGEPCMQEHKFYGFASTWGVVCLDCCAETRQFYESQRKAAEAWNRRAENG